MIETVVVGTDGSPTAQRAVDFAVDLAARYDAKVVAASSYTPVPEGRLRHEREEAPKDVQWAISPSMEADEYLRAACEAAKERGIEASAVARTGDPAHVLCDLAEELEADVLVVGSKGMHHRVLGSIPNTVSHRAPCSVVIVKTT